MNAELIAVGTELLLGEIADTDGQFVSQCLSELGINVFYHTVVGDNPARLRAELTRALGRSDLVITTGGLGPTYDDLTKEIIADTLGRRLVRDGESLARIERFFEKIGRVMTENNKKQADMPENCVIFSNDWGTAPGCAVEADGCTVIMLPGPPRECRPMMTERVMPYLRAKSDSVIASRRIRVFGMGESAVEDRLKSMMESSLNPTVAPYAKDGEVLLRVTAKAASAAECEALLAPATERIKAELPGVVYGVDVESLEEALFLRLKERKMTFACAESCTGGLVAKRMTDLPGSSEVFLGGVVSYANSVKEDLLGVPARILEQYGAVSPAAAAYMALGVLRLTGADLAVSLTGIAGPSGGSEEKPVGLVYAGVALRGAARVAKLNLGGPTRTRDLIRWLAASQALNLALKAVK